MRIADKMNYDQVKSNISKNRTEMADLQNQAASQKRVNKPSDDPLAATRVLQTRTEIGSGQQFLKSVSQAKTFLEYSDQAIGELTEIINRAKELALGQANDPTSNPTARSAVASEIDQLFSQAVQTGNRKFGDRFIFGGFKTTRTPFDAEGKYYGDNGEIKISIQKEGSVAMNMPGNRIFLGQELKAPATAGPDPGSISNRSFSDEEFQRSVHERDQQGEDRSLELRGPASLRPPLRDRPYEMPVEKPDPHEAHNINEAWSNGGVNVFHTLRDLAVGLKANDKQAVQESLDRLDEAAAQVVLARSQLGARVSTLNNAMESLTKGQVDAKTLASSLEDVDTFELVSDLNKSESTLKASLMTSGKLIQTSLLDFLR